MRAINFRRLSRQLTASVIATAIDLVLLLTLCFAAGVPPSIAAGTGAVAGGVVNFAIGRAWVFESRGPVLAQAVGYAGLVLVCGALLNAAIVGTVVATGVPLLIAKAFAVAAVMIGWTYPASSRIFKIA